MARTYTVKKGDTLSEIALEQLGDAAAYLAIASWNGISNPDLIYVGQVLLLESPSTDGVRLPSQTTKVTIKQFGLQANTTNTLFVTWSWNMGQTDHYLVKWEYKVDGTWFEGATNTKTVSEHDPDAARQDTWSYPDNAESIRVKVKPVSKTKTVNDVEQSYWTAKWVTATPYFHPNELPPSKPSAPSVTIKDYRLTAKLENLDLNATDIQFQVVKDDTTVYNTGMTAIVTNQASYACSVAPGSEYKVRCRAHRDGLYSDWSDYSSNAGTAPSAPSSIVACRATSETSIYLEWAAVNSAETYDIEYATDKNYFDGSDNTTTESGIETAHYEKTGLETGQEYFFRVRAVNSSGTSAWTEPVSIIIGKAPAAPTTWSSTTTVITGEKLYLYWVHNAEDGSSQVSAILELTVGSHTQTISVQNSTDEDEKDKTSVYELDTSGYSEGTTIQWRVKTCGITGDYGDWSIQRTITVYAPASLGLDVTDQNGNSLSTISAFPFYIRATSGPYTQNPVSYHVVITSNEVYETVDRIGNTVIVNKGGQVYSKHFDIDNDALSSNPYELLLGLSAGNLDLEDDISYTVTCTVAMDSGLTGEASATFTVSWSEETYTPNAAIAFDPDTLAAYIQPYCKDTYMVYRQVTFANSVYTVTDTELSNVYGGPVKNAKTTTGEQVYYGITADTDENGDPVTTDIYYCSVEEGGLIDGVTLSVYRREFDGSFTELATGIDNMSNTSVTDPHPALDCARYRIVAIDDSTGAVSYSDLPGYPIGEKAVIIQWDENWTNFDTTNEDALEQPAWAGSLLKLPYNIDVSDSHAPDVELIEYIGRKHPVSYYGTQTGVSSSWNVEIPKNDIETLYALRRLAVWMGDVYVREPSGSGYWANIVVSFSQTHCELTIPVSLSITRVEGGM